MTGNMNGDNIVSEEIKSTKLFLLMFYIIYIGYDLFYYFIYPKLKNKSMGLPEFGLGYWFYFLMFGFLPISIYFLKKKNPFVIKYIYSIGFILLEVINYILITLKNSNYIHDGNVVEVFLMLFSPIFINKRYYWVVISILSGKYLFYTMYFQSLEFLFPVVIILVIGIVSYIFLARFTSYIKTLTSMFERQRQNEKLAVLGQMATSIGHEIRNPLSSLKGFTQLQQERDNSENSFYPIMIQEIDRINSIVDDLMILGRPKMNHFEKHDLNKIVDYVTSVTSQLAENTNSRIVVEPNDKLSLIECNEKQIKQALINIIKNALESMPTGGTVEVKLVRKGSGKINIEVQDQGCGIDKEKLQKLGEPFYTTKPEGTGLGLLITKKIIEDHNGELRFESKENKGTKVTINIPMKQNK
ncbi:ATP-binding protein [Bacillus marasmi]|uniref:ATP-binding protein n=1 Tax=Bacillus marasmi TaxID=1926279 RepID=UPI0011CB2501|nr:ATP-binding protein [Bacillus marasmi]